MLNGVKNMGGMAASYVALVYPLLILVVSILAIVLFERLVRHGLRNLNIKAKVLEERAWAAADQRGREGQGR